MITVWLWVQSVRNSASLSFWPTAVYSASFGSVFFFFLLVKHKEQSFMLDPVTVKRTEGRKQVRCGQPGTCALGSKSPQRHLLYISCPPTSPSFLPSASILSDRLSAIAESRLSPNRILFLIWTYLFLTKAVLQSPTESAAWENFLPLGNVQYFDASRERPWTLITCQCHVATPPI